MPFVQQKYEKKLSINTLKTAFEWIFFVLLSFVKIILNPKYESLRPFVADIVKRFEQSDEVLHSGRNTIKVCREGGIALNVKRYGRPHWFNRIVYSFVRKPKGERAYRNGGRLLAAGFDSPEPVAYVEMRRGGIISDSYFVSLQCDYSHRLYELGDADAGSRRPLLRALARYTAALHEAGFMHLDYSPGNILYETDADGNTHFALVDTNRMAFGLVDLRRGCANFARLWGQPEMFAILADEYAAVRGGDPAKCRRWVRAARDRFWRRFSRRHKLKYDLKF